MYYKLKMALSKRLIVALGIVVLIIFPFLWFVNDYIGPKNQPAQNPQNIQEITKTFTAEELKKYDGTDPKLPIYIALDGLVYDVTSGSKFYVPGGSYHYLAGKDSSAELHLVGGDIIKRKYPVVGKLTQ